MKKPYDRFCVALFSALANPLRIAVLQRLVEKERTVNDLVKVLGEERTLISHNLADLLEVGLVSFRKDGTERIYNANPDIVPPLFYLLENFVCTGCSFRKTCRVMHKRDMQIRMPASKRKTCPGCIHK